MSRLSYLASNPKRVLGVVAALGASAAVVATGASFTYDTDSAATAFKTGKLVMNAPANQEIFGEQLRLNLLPGESSNWEKGYSNSASSTYNAKCKLRMTVINPTTGTDPQGNQAGDTLKNFIKIGATDYDITNYPTVVSNDLFGGGHFGAGALLSSLVDANGVATYDIPGVIKPGETRKIGFQWKAIDSGRGLDNKFESASLSLKATWLCDATKATS